MRKINEIIVHCTATKADWWQAKPTKAKVNEVRRWHVQERGWADIGYHYLIDRDGTVVPGRPLETAGAHTAGRNTNTIGICLFGGFGSAANDPFEKNYTAEQGAALLQLIEDLQKQFPEIQTVSGHNQYAAKACPGFDVPSWRGKQRKLKNSLVSARKSPLQSTTIQASTAQIAGGLGTAIAAINTLDGTTQLVLIGLAGVITLAALWIMRERLRKWAEGDV